MKRNEPRSFAEIFNEAVEQSGHADTFAEQQAAYLWSEIVGPGVNRLTTRRMVVRGVLHVTITSAALKHELSFHRTRIAALINTRLGKNVITSIEIH